MTVQSTASQLCDSSLLLIVIYSWIYLSNSNYLCIWTRYLTVSTQFSRLAELYIKKSRWSFRAVQGSAGQCSTVQCSAAQSNTSVISPTLLSSSRSTTSMAVGVVVPPLLSCSSSSRAVLPARTSPKNLANFVSLSKLSLLLAAGTFGQCEV